MKWVKEYGLLIIVLIVALTPQASSAYVLTSGLTYSIASRGATCGEHRAGIPGHYHSFNDKSLQTDFQDISPLAEVGESGGSTTCEELRGLSEFDLAGLDLGSASLKFDIFRDYGLFNTGGAFDGNIDILAYAADGIEQLSDYAATPFATVGVLNTTGMSVGDVINFDVSTILNTALTSGYSALGIRLQLAADTFVIDEPYDTTHPHPGGGWLYNNFRLVTSVPEPACLALMGLGLVGLGFSRRKKVA